MIPMGPTMHRDQQRSLTFPNLRAYASPIAAQQRRGFSSPECVGGRTAPVRYFFVHRLASPMGGPCGRAKALPVPTTGLLTRTVPPTRLAAGKRMRKRSVGVLP